MASDARGRGPSGAPGGSSREDGGTGVRRTSSRSTAVLVGLVVVIALGVVAALVAAARLTDGTDTVSAADGAGADEGADAQTDPDPTDPDQGTAGDGTTDPQDDAADPGTADAVTVGDCTYLPEGPASREVGPVTEADLPAAERLTWTLATNRGDVVVDVDAAGAPCTVAALSSLSSQGFYDDTPCHRVTDQGIFVVQCGDPTGTGTGGPGYRYAEENLPEQPLYPAGTVAMAKTAAPSSTGSQFFLVWEDSPLDPLYTEVGQVTQGLDLLQQVGEAGPTSAADPSPVEPVQILSSSFAPAG